MIIFSLLYNTFITFTIVATICLALVVVVRVATWVRLNRFKQEK